MDGLAQEDTIVIKPVDKGGAIVIMDRTEYVAQARQQLSDTNSYQPIQTDPTAHIKTLLLMVLREALSLGIIDNALFLYLQVSHLRTPLFYMLPKLHKGLHPP